MKRVKHKVKREKEASSSYTTEPVEHDLAYYIHDRVELMHQVFSAIKSKELRAMAPQCVRHLTVDNLQELCLEELLGISSKRLCAILDGAEPPSDTDSSSQSSPDNFETISLDSISSDDEILSQVSSKKNKKHKHRHKDSKSKHKKKCKEKVGDDNDDADKNKASRAGLTVLELLELQARARAIRAQLHNEQAAKTLAGESSLHSSDNEVEIKEEPAEVVEISSEDEKPNIEQLQKVQSSNHEAVNSSGISKTVTRKVNDLTITVPKAKPTKKIKLNRKIPKTSLTIESESNCATIEDKSDKTETTMISEIKHSEHSEKTTKELLPSVNKTMALAKTKAKRKQKKQKRIMLATEGSDNDEITLQLSDTEKMDLLKGLERKHESSDSSSEDSESSSSESRNDNDQNKKISPIIASGKYKKEGILHKETKSSQSRNNNTIFDSKVESNIEDTEENISKEMENLEDNSVGMETVSNFNRGQQSNIVENMIIDSDQKIKDESNNFHHAASDGIKGTDNLCTEPLNSDGGISGISRSEKDETTEKKSTDSAQSIQTELLSPGHKQTPTNGTVTENKKDLSEGELSDSPSSVVEMTKIQSDVVCISDEETIINKTPKKKKTKKREKKSKKDKKNKECKHNFRDGADQNFYTEKVNVTDEINVKVSDYSAASPIFLNDVEILELSDDSSTNESDGITVLSKEPTTEEIEALSAKIDDIKREDVVSDEQIKLHEQTKKTSDNEIQKKIEDISWKDRYLDSAKVKRVLSVSNILNALRKKNKELKNKMEESKKVDNCTGVIENQSPKGKILEEGSINQYNTLEASRKYVDSVTVGISDGGEKISDSQIDIQKDIQLTNEMKADAKQLLKMYKKLLKYNDMFKNKDKKNRKRKPRNSNSSK